MYHTLSSDTLVLPPIDPYGPTTRWIDIFSRGMAGCEWNITPSESYVLASPSSGFTGGSNGTDTRVYLSVDWSSAPPAPKSTTINIAIMSSCGSAWGNYGPPTVQLPVNHTSIPSNFSNGFVESDGHIAMEAEHTSTTTSIDNISYLTIPNYGRTLSGVMLYPILSPTQPAGTGPELTYSIYTFTPVPLAKITLFLSPSLNFYSDSRPLKYGIAIDDEDPQVIQFVSNTTQGNLPNGWSGAVSDAVWGLTSGSMTTTSHRGLLIPGEHTVRIWLVEPGVVVQKIIVDLGGVRASYLGPPESFWVGKGGVEEGYEGLNFTEVKTSSTA